MSATRRRAAALVTTALCAASLPASGTTARATPKAPTTPTAPKASLTDIENDVMCVSCREPLAVAQSPQAYAERNFIRTLIAKGQTKRQIERALVAQYGPAVLARPPARGFDLTIYVLPPAILLAGIAILALALPRWRRGNRPPAGAPSTKPSLSPADAQRLAEDLARHDI